MKHNLLLWTHENYSFLRRLRVHRGADVSPLPLTLPPLLQMSAALSLRCLQKEENRLLLVVPCRDHCARWIALCLALETMRNEYSKVLSSFNFKRGQKVRVNGNCIAHFERIDENDFIWLSWQDGATWSFAPSKELHLQPISEHLHATKEARAVEKLGRTRHNTTFSALDALLQIRTRGNLGLFQNSVALVSEIGATRDFACDHRIGAERLSEALVWASLSDGGNAKSLHAHSLNAAPTLMVANNIHGASAWSESQNDKCRALVFDGVRRATQSLGALEDRVLDKRVPVVVVCDAQDSGEWAPLIDRGFGVWNWDKEKIAPATVAPEDKTVFAFWRCRVENFRRDEIVTHQTTFSVFDEVAESLLVFERALEEENSDWRIVAGEVYGHLNTQAREVFQPDATAFAQTQETTRNLCAQTEAPDMWLSQTVLAAKENLTVALRKWSENAETTNEKCDLLRALLTDGDGEITVVCTDEDAAKNSRHYWSEERRRNRAPRRALRFVSVDQLLRERVCYQEIVVSGWLGGRRMSELLRAPFAARVHVLLCPFEARWCSRARRFWQQTSHIEYSMSRWSAWLGLSGGELHVPAGSSVAHFENGDPQGKMLFEETPTVAPELSDIDDALGFEVRVRQTKYAASGARSPDDETERAKLTIFRDGRWAFFSEFRRVWRATEIVQKTGKTIPRTRVADLGSGDWVVFRQSGRDAIREVADHALKKSHPDARRLSGLWREALRHRLKETDGRLQTLAQELQKNGFARHYTTLRGWVFDDDIIGPADPNDLLHIAVATGDRELERLFEEVKAAISLVRSAHLQAADAIEQRLMRDLPNLVKDRVLDGGALEFELPEIGRAELLAIEEIDCGWKECSVRECNRLMA